MSTQVKPPVDAAVADGVPVGVMLSAIESVPPGTVIMALHDLACPLSAALQNWVMAACTATASEPRAVASDITSRSEGWCAIAIAVAGGSEVKAVAFGMGEGGSAKDAMSNAMGLYGNALDNLRQEPGRGTHHLTLMIAPWSDGDFERLRRYAWELSLMGPGGISSEGRGFAAVPSVTTRQ